jgi:protein SCO1/2
MSRMNIRSPRRARMRGRMAPQTLIILSAALALGAGLLAGQRYFAPSAPELPVLQGALAYPTPRELPPFTLQQSDGTALSREELAGRWTLVFFGFTHCPDICPTTLALLVRAQEHWADLPAEQQPRVLFVSVDPERDSPQRTGEYAAYFGPDIVAATAEHAVLEPFARSLGMVYMKTALPAASAPAGSGDGDAGPGNGAPEPYTVDHSSSVAVLDPDVRLVAVLRPPLDADVVAADLRALVEARQ